MTQIPPQEDFPGGSNNFDEELTAMGRDPDGFVRAGLPEPFPEVQERPRWLVDLDVFGASHKDALIMAQEAIERPEADVVEAAKTATALIRTNGDKLFGREFYREMAIDREDPNTIPLQAAIHVMVESIREIDAYLCTLTPFRMGMARIDGRKIQEMVDGATVDDKDDAMEVLAELSRLHSSMCNELEAMVDAAEEAAEAKNDDTATTEKSQEATDAEPRLKILNFLRRNPK